jgi:hypothetical protein
MATYIPISIDDLVDVWGLRPVAGGIWSPGAYVAGAVANYQGNLYFANTQTSGVPGVSPDWTLLIAAAYAPVVAYISGINASATAPVTMVTQGGTLYACTTSHTTTSTFEAGNWLALVSSSAGSLVEVAGGWDASTNTPPLASGIGTNGAIYRVTTAGDTTLDGTGDWNVGDYAWFSIDAWRKLRGQSVLAKDISDATASGRTLITAADVPAQRLALRIDGATIVDDANIGVTGSMTRLVFITLSASRVVGLQPLTFYAVGQTIEIFDETGDCSPSRTITINRAGSDTINDEINYVLAAPFSGVRLTKVSAAKWTAHQLEPMRKFRTSSATSYTYLLADNRGVVARSASADMTDTLPVFSNGFSIDVQNIGTGLLTITPASGTIAGLASLVLPPNAGVSLISDGTNYRALGVVPQRQGRWLLKTYTASASSSLSDATIFQNGFNGYEVVLEDFIPVANNDTLAMRVRSAGSYQATNYKSAGEASNEIATALTGALTTGIQLTRTSAVSNAGMGVRAEFSIRGTAGTTAHKPAMGESTYIAATYLERAKFAGAWQSNGALDGFMVYYGGGNIASGVMRVYGVA